MEITSRTNPLVQKIVALHSAKGREAAGRFIAEGTRACSALITSGAALETLCVTHEHVDFGKKYAPKHYVMVADHVMEKLSTTHSASGVLGVFRMPQAPSFDALDAGIVLARIADPGNVGTLIRTAAAMNARSVVIIEGAEPWNPKVVQATAGAIGTVQIFRMSWQELIAHKKDIPLCALVVRDGVDASTIPSRSLIVVGSETHGIPEEWLASCDMRIHLAMPGETESLNAAIAGSIALYLTHARRSS